MAFVAVCLAAENPGQKVECWSLVQGIEVQARAVVVEGVPLRVDHYSASSGRQQAMKARMQMVPLHMMG